MTVSAATAAISTAEIPPYPIDLRNTCGNTSSPASDTATVTAENATVRPAVRNVLVTAVCTSSPRPISSRNRLTMNSP